MTKIGLFGFGCVAQGFYEGLKRNPGIKAAIKTICVKNGDKKRTVSDKIITTDPSRILDDPEIDVVIELIDDAEAARGIVFQALERGVPVISANKKMIAENLSAIDELSKKIETPFFYEGAVAGSIPILHTIQQFFGSQEILEIRGILNGSTNYILTQMNKRLQSMGEALKDAQDLGFAETDPSLDVSGMDAAYKAAILAYHAFGKIADLSDIEIAGIDQIDLTLISESRRENQKVKLIAEIRNEENNFSISVKPQLVRLGDPMYFVDDESNGVTVTGDLSGPQTYVGKGAGSLPTGSAVLHDLTLLIDGFKYSHTRSQGVLRKSA